MRYQSFFFIFPLHLICVGLLLLLHGPVTTNAQNESVVVVPHGDSPLSVNSSSNSLGEEGYEIVTGNGESHDPPPTEANPHGGPKEGSDTECHKEAPHDTIQLASFRWDEIGIYFTITAFIIIAGFAKLGFHKLHWLSSKVPESCLLVLLGLAVSLLVFFTSGTDDPNLNPCHRGFEFPQFTSKIFFLILLPPIILDSAYSLYDRVFLDNLGTVLVFAVVGTFFNVFAIGLSLYGIYKLNLIPNMDFTLIDALVFSSLISAVDPVAVLAIFQELGVNQNLYFLIFGESLLNDGVTVVLYNTMQAFRRMSVISAGQIALAILSFFITSFGGVFIGIFYGLLTALMTKWTCSVRVVEPLALLGLAYLSYLTAELFHFSGIICLIVCGLIQAHYAFSNISHKSYICVKYFTKMASATSDTVIFMFLGMLLVNKNHQWNTAFVIWSLVFCFVYRFIGVFVLSAITNIYRSKSFDLEEQFICAYGGLRGAVAFSLASTLDDNMPERNTYIFTTLIVILFTIFVQGITIKPLVGLLNIKRKSDVKKNMTEEITTTGIDHIMAGIEEILGHHGDFYLREMIMHYNDKYLKKWLIHEESDTKLTRLFEKICLSEHYAHLYGPVALVEDNIKPLAKFSSNEALNTPMITSTLSISREEIYGSDADNKKTSIDNYINEKPDSHTLPPVEELNYDGELPPPVTANRRRTPLNRSRRSFTSNASATPVPPPKEDTGVLLRKALKDNRYNKLHYTYNKNLVDEENQELSSHLNRRAFNANRMSTIAAANYEGAKSVRFEALTKSLILLERHKKSTMKSWNLNSSTPATGGSGRTDQEKGDVFSVLMKAQENHIMKMFGGAASSSSAADDDQASLLPNQPTTSDDHSTSPPPPPSSSAGAVTDGDASEGATHRRPFAGSRWTKSASPPTEDASDATLLPPSSSSSPAENLDPGTEQISLLNLRKDSEAPGTSDNT